jgi:hypothetical protein
MGYLSVTTTPPFAGYLYEKTDGSITGEETGVGLSFNDPATGEPGDHEVFAGQFLRVDLNDGLLAGLINFKIDLASVQAGETYRPSTSRCAPFIIARLIASGRPCSSACWPTMWNGICGAR